MKRYVAFARVSSREQQREGFSLDVQEDALRRYAQQHVGEIVHFAKVAETASDDAARTHFKETIEYAIRNAHQLDAILFYKVDRAIRNTHDLCLLEELESKHGVLVEFVSQPMPHSPAGWLQIRNLGNMATYQTQQQSVDVKEGVERRVRAGLFPQKAPFGYQNHRENGRGLVKAHPENATKVRRIFDLYAYHGHTLDSLVEQLDKEGIAFSRSKPKFGRSKVADILIDRSYIGEVWFRGEWWPGSHDHLIDSETWERVQTLLGRRHYKTHDLLFAGMIKCGHCGRAVTGEVVKKLLKSGQSRRHTYYRCARYNQPSHPRHRIREGELEKQVLESFAELRIEEDGVREWFGDVLRRSTQAEQRASVDEVANLNRQLSSVRSQQDELLNLRLLGEIERDTYARKSQEFRDRERRLMLQIEAISRHRHENADLAVKAFELSQSLAAKWLTADFDAKRRLVEIVCLNLTLDDVTLVPEWRKPFDVLAEGLSQDQSRGDRI